MHWLRARAQRGRWSEELNLVQHEMQWTLNFICIWPERGEAAETMLEMDMAPSPNNAEDAEHTPNAKCPCGTTSVKSRRRRFRRQLSILYQKGTTSRDLIVHQSNRLHSLCILPTMMYLVASYPTDRMPVPHSEQEAISRLKLHMMLARLRSAVRAFLVKATKDDNDIWGQ